MRAPLSSSFDWKAYLPFHPARPAQAGEPRDRWRTPGGAAVALRAARTDDGERMQSLVRGLSLESRYHRFFYPAHELPPDMLDRFTHNDPASAMTLLAVTEGGEETVIAMAQYVADGYPDSCDFAVVVADGWQGQGIATRLLQTLVCIARRAGIARVEGDILADNNRMLTLMLAMGFTLRRHPDGPTLIKASKQLDAPKWKCSPLMALATRVPSPQQARA